MAFAAFKATSNVLANFNACFEFFNRVISVAGSLPNSPVAQHQIQEEKGQMEAKLLHLKDDLWKLKTTMPKMHHLIERVEWQVLHMKVADSLLPDIKCAVYDAEDILDDFNYYVLKMKVEERKNSGKDTHAVVMEFYKSLECHDHFNKVQRIQQNLDHIHAQSKDLRLHKAPMKFDISIRPHSMPNSVEKKIFGRDKELKELVETLGVPTRKRGGDEASSWLPGSQGCGGEASEPTHKRGRGEAGSWIPGSQRCGGEASERSLEAPDNSGEARMTELAVLPIVGIGGVGKTTMAQQICDDANVRIHFGCIIWICVSDEFGIKRLAKEILEQLGQGTSSDNLIVLTTKLASCLKSKRFLLVLDDMWDDILERDGEEWKSFYAALMANGSQGSKILVTTRSPNVAKLVGTVEQYELKGLPHDVFLEFFNICAFGFNDSCDHPELERIARAILPKLKGSPLAAKTLGRLLQRDLSTEHWDNILQSELWKIKQEKTDILPALRLSYMYLPQYMKRCFSICALYPKDYKFQKEELVDFWIAQEFVEPQDASSCFDDLVNLSFFQRAPYDDMYLIHDLLHDMVQLVSKEECFIIKHLSDLDIIPSNVRHLSIFTREKVSCSELKRISIKKKLRSLVLKNLRVLPEDYAPVLDCWFKELLEIRVLRFQLNVKRLPKSIGNLKHLRHLDLGLSSLETFPSSVSCLYHLQTIEAVCSVFRRYPQGFNDLISLKKFKSRGLNYKKGKELCLEDMIEEQIELLPRCFQNNIRVLKIKSYHGESCPSWLHPNFLKRLTKLVLHVCPHIQSMLFFEPLSHHPESDSLYHLEQLHITVCPKIDWQTLMALPSSLRRVNISNFDHSADHFVRCFHGLTFLTSLTIVGCVSLTSIPLQVWSRNLPSLEDLHILCCQSLTSISASEESSSNVGAFSSLHTVSITHCSVLLSVDELLTPAYLPVVRDITVKYCLGLTSLPIDRLHGFSCLEKLELGDCPKLNVQRVMTLPSSLKYLILMGCPSIESIDNHQLGDIPTLKRIELHYCRNLKSIAPAISLAHIEEVLISGCPHLTEIPQPFEKGTGR